MSRSLSTADFKFLVHLLKRVTGIVLDTRKLAMTQSRLKPLAARYGFASLPALIQELRAGDENLARKVGEAMTIRDTSFFRDGSVFATLHDAILPSLFRARIARRGLRIWSAAAATGQEAYSLAMTIDAMPQFIGWDIEIVASDASSNAIGRARDGLYRPAEVQRGLPAQLLSRYFREENGQWRISAALRGRVSFRTFNLFDNFAELGVFDLILCRNVLIYFDAAAKANILARLAESLQDDGYLVLGAAETVLGSSNSLVPSQGAPGIIVKSPAAFAPRPAIA